MGEVLVTLSRVVLLNIYQMDFFHNNNSINSHNYWIRLRSRANSNDKCNETQSIYFLNQSFIFFLFSFNEQNNMCNALHAQGQTKHASEKCIKGVWVAIIVRQSSAIIRRFFYSMSNDNLRNPIYNIVLFKGGNLVCWVFRKDETKNTHAGLTIRCNQGHFITLLALQCMAPEPSQLDFTNPLAQSQTKLFLTLLAYTQLEVKPKFYGERSTPGLGNVRPAGHIRPAKHFNVARELCLKFFN